MHSVKSLPPLTRGAGSRMIRSSELATVAKVHCKWSNRVRISSLVAALSKPLRVVWLELEKNFVGMSREPGVRECGTATV